MAYGSPQFTIPFVLVTLCATGYFRVCELSAWNSHGMVGRGWDFDLHGLVFKSWLCHLVSLWLGQAIHTLWNISVPSSLHTINMTTLWPFCNGQWSHPVSAWHRVGLREFLLLSLPSSRLHDTVAQRVKNSGFEREIMLAWDFCERIIREFRMYRLHASSLSQFCRSNVS